MSTQKPTIAKQAMGALVGGTLALGLYYAYDYSEPTLTGYISITKSQLDNWLGNSNVGTSARDLDDETVNRIKARTERALRSIVKKGETDSTAYDEQLPNLNAQPDDLIFDSAKFNAPENNSWAQVRSTADLWKQEERRTELANPSMDTRPIAYEPQDSWDTQWNSHAISDSFVSGDAQIHAPPTSTLNAQVSHSVRQSNAPALPSSGLGTTLAFLGASAGAISGYIRKKKRT